MTLFSGVVDDLQRRLGAAVVTARPVAGGDIHSAYEVALDDDRKVFVKTSEQTPAGMFAAECAGLQWLANFAALPVPVVLIWRDQTGREPGYLALQWHSPSRHRGARTGAGSIAAEFGAGLARLHGHDGQRPGWHRDCFIGRMPQTNAHVSDSGSIGCQWTAFWIERRLQPMAKLAGRDLGRRGRELVDEVCARCAPLLKEVDHVGPLHGDLWSGNALWTDTGAMLIDPAVYVGDPEVDLAMMALFGGFPDATWSAYFNARPRRAGFERRRDLYQLWPLLVHVALFGTGYTSQVERAASRVLAAV